ncbi:hypothetical protein MSAN_00761200 [Mycena sanguinolenta]|uniref:Protein kinase domain-containing protein n=1 Tax=Mycena sanguinolenta TaxID=230812 RepID=A0A8H6Z633_9AGAR|nr:hypothetical protein MSAN_00761200 [Mycena sanguinolenta]
MQRRYIGAFFPNASGFAIHGGKFTINNVYNFPTEHPAGESFLFISFGPYRYRQDFGPFYWGDVKLGKEIRTSSVVGQQIRGTSARRMYAAEIRRDPGPVTVAVYQGHGAEEEWREHLAKYESIRHPNIMQLYGLVSASGIRAMVFYDELIPLSQFLSRFRHSPILKAYILSYCNVQRREALDYLRSVLPTHHYDKLPVWMKITTGELCVDLVQAPETDIEVPWPDDPLDLDNISLEHSATAIISTLNEDDYPAICSWRPVSQSRWFQVSTRHPIGLATFRWNFQHRTLARVTEALHLEDEQELRWHQHTADGLGEAISNSWIRFRFSIRVPRSPQIQNCWQAQANDILTQILETAHLQDYVCVDTIWFILQCFPNTHATQKLDGYLFTVLPTGHSMSLELSLSVKKTPNSTDFPYCISKPLYVDDPAATMYAIVSKNFTEARGTLQRAGIG